MTFDLLSICLRAAASMDDGTGEPGRRPPPNDHDDHVDKPTVDHLINLLLDAETDRLEPGAIESLRHRLVEAATATGPPETAGDVLLEVEAARALNARIAAVWPPPDTRHLRDAARRVLFAAAEQYSVTDSPTADAVRAAVAEAHRIERHDRHPRMPDGKSVGETRTRVRPILIRTWQRSLAIAASIVMVGLAVWRVVEVTTPPGYDFGAQKNLAEVWAHAESREFAPEWLCENGREFYRQFYVRFNEGLVLDATMPDAVGMAGLGYARVLSNESVYVYSFAHGADLLVVVDRLDAEHAALDAAGLPRFDDDLARSGIEAISPRAAARVPFLGRPVREDVRLFRRIIGDLVLYELTPLDRAEMLPWLELPSDVPRSWRMGGADTPRQGAGGG